MMKFSLPKIDWWLLTPVFVLIIIGLLTLFSLNVNYFKSQLIYTLGSLVVFFFVSRIDHRLFKEYGFLLYIVSVIALFVVFLIGIESKGAARWIEIFGVRLQLSELCKPLLAISLASFLSGSEERSLKSYLMVGVLLIPIFLLIFFQPDLGNAMIYALTVLFTLLVFGYPIQWFIVTAIPFLLASPFLWTRLHDYQKQRLITFLNPSANPMKEGYNVMQAIIAVGSGGFMGKGFGAGTQSGLRFLPERHTDFIFATISEGLGFLGAMIVVACFFFLCFRIYQIIMKAEQSFEKLFAITAFNFILIHFFVNAGMNAGIVPVVGVTLPFVSAGGSSLLSNFIFLGILSQISMSQKRDDVLEIR